jgi:hypothetical protein
LPELEKPETVYAKRRWLLREHEAIQFRESKGQNRDCGGQSCRADPRRLSPELGEEYLRKRNALLDLKYKREAMLLARDRDQLIERELVLHQLAYLMIPLRQKILGIPSKLGNRFGNCEVPVREVADFCRTLVHEALTEVSNLPLTVSDPHWLKKAEDWLEKSESKD